METILVAGSFLLFLLGKPATAINMPPPPPITLTISTSSPEWIKLRIKAYADFYDADAYAMDKIVRCESGYNKNAVGDKGLSHGLVQIHLPAHEGVTLEQARDIDFSLNFLAKNKDNWNMWTCWKMLQRS